MSAPNRNVLWGDAVVDELAKTGVGAAVVSPGSRSTPLTVALARHDGIETYSVLDERAAAYFALGRARRTGRPTPLVCTSGTAAANYAPAVIEADTGRVPMLLLTADRPPALRDSGANQTVDQEKLYGDAVRYYTDLPEPEATDRKLRSLRTTVARALSAAVGTPPGPVHLNAPFRKPLEPTPVPGDVPDDLDPAAESGRGDAFVRRRAGVPELADDDCRALARALSGGRALVVAGPADPPGLDPEPVTALAHAADAPILADPLSGLRFGPHARTATVLGGYDGFLTPDLAAEPGWPDPDVVLRLGASPTSKALRNYLAATDADQHVVDPAGEWREAEFTATDLVVADPARLCGRLARLLEGSGPAGSGPATASDGETDWRERWAAADETAFAAFREAAGVVEGRVVAAATADAPEPATLFVSNSMPVRDLDRFAPPRDAALTALGNRGASGIDGITSTALGAGSATADATVAVVGDLAFYHDATGLLSASRCGVPATLVVINNDGGGIFHKLPIESFDPPFTGSFKTPHGLEFGPLCEQFDLAHEAVDARGREPGAALSAFRSAYADALAVDGGAVVEVRTDAETSHRERAALKERVVERVRAGESEDGDAPD
jgi:2-succinyl-5-enolpyruvyl-6-hydroxy-3-cyclohexene-1-carboxylate synthase